jgi:ABC-type Na+ efflux pump permease subunit
MLNTIKGYYDNGEIVLSESPQITGKTSVLVTFLANENIAPKQSERRLGILSGKITIPDNFNDECDDFNKY